MTKNFDTNDDDYFNFPFAPLRLCGEKNKQMKTKLTLHFDKSVIEKTKTFAAENNISLSRLTEFLYRQITSGNYKTLEDFPLADWVSQVAEGEAVYKKRNRKTTKDEFFNQQK